MQWCIWRTQTADFTTLILYSGNALSCVLQIQLLCDLGSALVAHYATNISLSLILTWQICPVYIVLIEPVRHPTNYNAIEIAEIEEHEL